jgi:hypothetical protein
MRCNFAPASAPCRDSYCPGLSITYPVLGTTDERQMAFDLRNHCARSGTRTTFQCPRKHWQLRKHAESKQFAGGTRYSATKSVDIVHTLLWGNSPNSVRRFLSAVHALDHRRWAFPSRARA